MGLRQKARRFKKSSHAAGIVIGARRIDHRIKMRADNYTPIACPAREAGNHIMEDLT